MSIPLDKRADISTIVAKCGEKWEQVKQSGIR